MKAGNLARAALPLVIVASADAQHRALRPEDLFRVEKIGAIAWSPDGAHAAVEIRREDRWLDSGIPSGRIAVVDVGSGRLRIVATPSTRIVGYFRPVWSPSGRRLLFLGVDTSAVVRPWVWTMGSQAASEIRGVQLHDALGDSPRPHFIDDDHALFLARDTTIRNSGSLYTSIMRGRNVADAWRRARAARDAMVMVLDAGGPDTVTSETSIVSIDIRTGIIKTLARGPLHAPRLSPDRRVITYHRENPKLLAAKTSTFFGSNAFGEDVYDPVNLGTEIVHIDARTGAPTSPPDTTRPPASARSARLHTVNDPRSGTRLVLARPSLPDTTVWRGNEWLRDIALGHAESIQYSSTDGRPLTGWILLPPGYQAGRRIPIVTHVYPGRMLTQQYPRDFDAFANDFNHAQVFAALGYGVVLPSMPQDDRPFMGRALDQLTLGVLPLLDTIVARGIADSRRIAVTGQSAGGWAVLGLLTLTNRFRSAIASASYSNLASLYGTFYGQYRYGDGGRPQHAQLLRMLQSERGFFGAGAPPWEAPERYRLNSPIERVANVETPLMLIHGEIDFIPVQQAEEFFTALYRRDKRAKLVRYAGEGHTIAARTNVLDMWRRVADWLAETMPPAGGVPQ